MTDFEEMVKFLYQEAVVIVDVEKNVTMYRMEARFGLTKDFYVDFEKKKCSRWHKELAKLDVATIERVVELMDSNFKTHIEVQKELDRIW